MKIEKIILIVLALCFVSGAAAVSSDVSDSYKKGETIIAKFSGNILEPIEKGEVEFKRGNVRIETDYDVLKLGEEYYLWAIAPLQEANYTLLVKNIVTTVSGSVQKIDYEKTFSVSGELDYNVNPGAVFTKDDFEISVFLSEDLNREIDVTFVESKKVTLNPGANLLDFKIDKIKFNGLKNLTIGKYNVPVYIVTGKIGNESGASGALPDIRFNPRVIEAVVFEGGNYDFPVKIINNGSKKINDVEIVYNESIFDISPNKNIDLDSNDEIEILIKLKKVPEKRTSENIYAVYGNNSISLFIEFDVTKDSNEEKIPYLEEDYKETQNYYCGELSGEICSAKEVCEGVIEGTIDGSCCIGSCVEMKKSGSGALIGWLLVGIVVVAGLVVWIRYKRVKAVSRLDKHKVKGLP